MKKNLVVFAVLLLVLASCGEKNNENDSESKPKGRFDLTTPENFVKSLCKIGEGEVDVSVIDEFYATESAAVLHNFEEAVTEDNVAFDKLTDTLKIIYADSVAIDVNGKLELATIEEGAQMKYYFGSSGSSILESMKELKGDCAELVDFKENDKGGKLTLKMSNGNEISFYLIKNNGSYKIELDKENNEGMTNMVFRFRNTTHFYNTTRKRLAEEKIPLNILAKQMNDEYTLILERTSE